MFIHLELGKPSGESTIVWEQFMFRRVWLCVVGREGDMGNGENTSENILGLCHSD